MNTSTYLGKYQILGELGKGGFATVYRARDPDLGRDVALKVLDPLLTRDPVWVARFRREARAVASLDHPRVVTVHEIGQAEGSLYIAMRLVEGGSLRQRIETQGTLPWDEVVRLAGQIAEALDFAHGQGVLHRDLKPANVLLDPRLGAVLSDFGFASLVADNSLSISMSGGVVGTPAYIAPEVWEGDDPTPQTDVYALGCIVYELATGQMLFTGASTPAVMRAHFQPRKLPETWPEGTPPGLNDVLLAALAQEPASRYAAAGELSAALAGLRTDPLAEPYAGLQAAVEAGRWQDALALAGQVRTADAGYRDVVALEAAALAGLEQEARAQQAVEWRAEAERALADGDLKGAGMAMKKWQALAPDDPVMPEFQTKLENARRVVEIAHWRSEAERALGEERSKDASDAAEKWQTLAPDDPAIGAYLERLESARRAKEAARWRAEAEEALADGNFKNAGYTLNKWKQLAPEDPAVEDFRRRLIEATAKPSAQQQTPGHSATLPKQDASSSKDTAVGHLEIGLPNDGQTTSPSSPVPASTPPVSRSAGDGSRAWWLVPVALAVVGLLVITLISNAARREQEAALQAAQANTVAASQTERALVAVASEATATAVVETQIALGVQAANATRAASTQTAAPRATRTARARATAEAGATITARLQSTAEARTTATAAAIQTARVNSTRTATAKTAVARPTATALARTRATATARARQAVTATAAAQPRAVIKSSANIRSGPGTEFPAVGSAVQGDRLILRGKTADSAWYFVGNGWINASLLEVSGNTSSLNSSRAPVAIAPWRGEYFANVNLEGAPVLVREDRVLDLDWGDESPTATVPRDFSARWKGAVFVPSRTTFCITRDDFARVWVDGNSVYDVWTYTTEIQGTIVIDPGKHTIIIDWADTSNRALIEFGPC
jgi:hypothetical protein